MSPSIHGHAADNNVVLLCSLITHNTVPISIFNSPLNGLIGMTSILMHDARENKEQLDPNQLLESLQMIASSGDLLRSVVDDVLDNSKLDDCTPGSASH